MNDEIMLIANREVRVIPKGWQHPIDERGCHIPLLEEGHIFDDEERYPTMPATWNLAPEDTEIAAYETTTEGTPCSPAFPNTPQGRLALVNFCAEHCTTFGRHRAGAEAWAAILFGEAAVDLDGRVVAEG